MTAASDDPFSTHAGGDAPRALAILGAAGAGIVSLLAASCCVLPIGLTVVGLGGTWLTFLGPFVVWRGPILLVAALVIAVAWVLLYRRLRAHGRGCIRPRTLVVTALATASLALAMTAPLWERDASRALLSIYFDRSAKEAAQ